MADESLPRRRFLLGAGLAGAGVAAGLTGGLPAPAEAQTAPAAPKPATNAEPETFLTLTASEAAFISATADTIIPADELSPSGTDCGVVDLHRPPARQRLGRRRQDVPLRTVPARASRSRATSSRSRRASSSQAGIAAANAWSRKTYGKEFDRLSVADRVDRAEGDARRARPSSSTSRRAPSSTSCSRITMEGFFSDPIYGGNRNKVVVEDARLPRPAGDLCRQGRRLPRQALCRAAAIDRGLFVKGGRSWQRG